LRQRNNKRQKRYQAQDITKSKEVLHMKKIIVLMLVLMLSSSVAFAAGGKERGDKGQGTTSTGTSSQGTGTQDRTGR
jgi:hypothetical protein